MVTIDVRYQGDLRCEATHGPSGNTVITDAPVDNQGKGASFSPTDLCATALASCMATIMGIQARTSNINLEGMRLQVSKHMSEDSPRRIVKLPVEIWIPEVVSEQERAKLERAAHLCPVHQSLHPDIEKPIVFHWGK
jgi:putative redox protein